jgi:L-2-hydroxyglutarate oxidase LhgO
MAVPPPAVPNVGSGDDRSQMISFLEAAQNKDGNMRRQAEQVFLTAEQGNPVRIDTTSNARKLEACTVLLCSGRVLPAIERHCQRSIHC